MVKRIVRFRHQVKLAVSLPNSQRAEITIDRDAPGWDTNHAVCARQRAV